MNIPLTKGYFAQVDDIDYAHLCAVGRWSYSPSGYAIHYSKDVWGNYHTLYMHRIVMERVLGHPVGNLQVDHISSLEMDIAARRDNRRQNLRLATRSQNQAHKGKARNNTSHFKGVTLNGKKWEARICFAGQRIHLGNFSDPVIAAQMYDAASTRLNKEFAGLNFPEEITPPYIDEMLDSILEHCGFYAIL